MKAKRILNILILISVLISLMCFGLLLAPYSNASESSEAVGINLDNADIKKYIKYISELTGKKFIVDAQVKGTVTIYMPKKMSVAEAYNVFNSVLITNGYTTVDLGSVTKIIPTEKAKTEKLAVAFGNQQPKTKNKYITQIIKLKNVLPEELSEIIIPLIPSESVVVPHASSQSLIITDTKENIRKIKQIVKKLDIPKAVAAQQTIGIIKLHNMKAVDIETVLRDIIKDEEVGIKADAETNSILIASSQGELQKIKDVIQEMDKPRRMVYLESLILEVDTSENFSIGTKWLGLGEKGNTKGIAGWSGSSGAVIADGQEIASFGNGFSLGMLFSGIDIAGTMFPNITAVLNAYKSNDNIKIISTPQILTKNNKAASLSVGQNIPYLTKSEESNSGNGYSNYEYKDVATKLTILPQINNEQRLSLEIDLEVSKINSSASQQDKPTTYKRTIKTTVVVQDNETIVLGGIIGNDQSQSEWKIPILGDIPWIGWLFKETTTNTNQTNMFVFITPHIINNLDSIASITQDKKQIAEEPHGIKSILDESINEIGWQEFVCQ